MRWYVVAIVLALPACNAPKNNEPPHPSPIHQADIGPDDDAVFMSVEDHAECAGFHRAFAKLTSGSQSKVEFYTAAAADAETAATEIATSKISRELAGDMAKQLAQTHAAKWAYVIETAPKSDAIQAQAKKCFEMASEQEEIVRDVVKAKYGFRRR